MTTPRIVRPAYAELRKAVFEFPRPPHDIFMLVCETAEEGRHCIPLVYVSPSLQDYFNRGAVAAFDLHRLPQNGLAMRSLAAQPERLVTAIQLTDGSVVVEVPGVLAEVRKTQWTKAVAWAAAAAAGYLMSLSPAVLLLAPCAYQVRKALSVPVSPHPGLA